MTTLSTHPVDDPDQLALIADEWTMTKERFAAEFRIACQQVAVFSDGWVNPSEVRAYLMAVVGDYNPRQLSALWSTACSRDGYLDNTDRWVQITGAGSKGNTNKSVRLRRWRGWVS
jgi:phosphoribosylformimino-5-aminoimidazole carboxamide ribonucleotide (ProFAR) isomerase